MFEDVGAKTVSTMKSGSEQMNTKEAELAETFARIEANVASYRALANAIASEVLGEAEMIIDVVATCRTYGPVMILSVPMDGFALRLQIEGTEARHPPRKAFAPNLRQRIEEAKVHGDRFVSDWRTCAARSRRRSPATAG